MTKRPHIQYWIWGRFIRFTSEIADFYISQLGPSGYNWLISSIFLKPLELLWA